MINIKNSVWDNPFGYGVVSRFFHWGMALLFMWQFTSVILRVSIKDTAAYGFFWPTHTQVGFALLILVLLRGVWGLLNIRRRPSYQGRLGGIATLGHILIYALMFAVPALALLRSYGSGRGFSFLGFEIFSSSGVQIPAFTAPGHALHGVLGWVLLAVIIGHVLMALLHHFVLRDNCLRYMTGRGARE